MSKKNIKRYFLAATLAGALLWAFWYFGNSLALKNVPAEKSDEINMESNLDQKYLKVKFFNQKSFYDSLAWLKKNPQVFPDCQVVAAIVPHHDLASFMPDGLFSKLALQGIETVILIGPNHDEIGGKMLTSMAVWETEFGKVYPNEKLIADLEQKNIVSEQDEILQNDHSISGLLPMLKYFIPNAKVIPIMLSNKNDQAEIEMLNENLESILNDKRVALVASVDFSHYLSQAEAEKNDNETLEIMKSFDYKKLYHLGNGNVDSPPSVATFLLASQSIGDGNINVISHANSADLLGSNITKTTSYFSLATCRKNNL
jgi:AmmeMemoRadiSam system protein B